MRIGMHRKLSMAGAAALIVVSAWMGVRLNAGTDAVPQTPDVGLIDLTLLIPQIHPVTEAGRTIWSYKLKVKESEHKLANGMAYKVFAYNGQVPGPLLIAREGDWVRIRLTNDTSTNHTIHSHGLFVPNRMDGVPHNHGQMPSDAPMPGPMPMAVPPGESFVYEYIARPSGTHWYHCHFNTNEHINRGMAGPLIVLPKEPEPAVDHDYVFLLQEWNSKYAREGTPGNPREVNDADFFTLNGKSFPDTPTVTARLGDTLRFRFINAGSQSHAMHLHGHTFIVTHRDGSPLTEPVEMDTVDIAPGQRVDIVFRANNPGEWPMHCHTTAHQTNGSIYPGGMMLHLQVGSERHPENGEGPDGPGNAGVLKSWRNFAHARLEHIQ
jgi:FtsP/CotA-like multicopper oxidase with cupredoxin domain